MNAAGIGQTTLPQTLVTAVAASPNGVRDSVAPGYEMSPELKARVAATRTDTGDVEPTASQRLMQSLPSVTQDQMLQFAATAVGLPAASIALQGLTGKDHSAAHIVFVEHDGQRLAVVKTTPDVETFVREVDGMLWVEDHHLDKVHAPRVLALGQNQDGNGVIAMSLAPGEGIDDLMTAVHDASPQDRPQALQRVHQAVINAAQTLAELHTSAPGSGTRVPQAYMDRYKSKLHDETFAKLDMGKKQLAMMGLNLDDIHQATDQAWDAMMAHPGINAVCHGDTHQGNFMDDTQVGTTLIDFNRLHQSLDAVGGPNGAPERDIAKFWYRLKLNGQEQGLSAAERQDLQDVFISTYRKSGAALSQPSLHFFTLQVALEAMVLLGREDKATAMRLAPIHMKNVPEIMHGGEPQLAQSP